MEIAGHLPYEMRKRIWDEKVLEAMLELRVLMEFQRAYAGEQKMPVVFINLEKHGIPEEMAKKLISNICEIQDTPGRPPMNMVMNCLVNDAQKKFHDALLTHKNYASTLR